MHIFNRNMIERNEISLFDVITFKGLLGLDTVISAIFYCFGKQLQGCVKYIDQFYNTLEWQLI